jgi:RNA polymerase sigma-70 factor (ECF subfamily)
MSGGTAQLVLEHSPFVWRVLIHLGVPRSRLEDASQEVFVALLKALPTFEGRSSLKTWIYGTCRNVAFTERRRARETTEIPSEELPETIVQPAQEGELWIRRAHERLVAALARLDEGQRQVFVLYEIEGLSSPEIAALLDVPLGSVASRLRRGREQFRDAVLRIERSLQRIQGRP